jgi:hypothetical protein
MRNSRACIMCFEADHDHCHRRIVAGHLANMTCMPVVPLKVKMLSSKTAKKKLKPEPAPLPLFADIKFVEVK